MRNIGTHWLPASLKAKFQFKNWAELNWKEETVFFRQTVITNYQEADTRSFLWKETSQAEESLWHRYGVLFMTQTAKIRLRKGFSGQR